MSIDLENIMRATPLLLLGMLVGMLAWAQDRPRVEPVPDIPPPPGIVDSTLEPQITITTRGADKVEEYRIKGRLYMIKVTPPHGRPYYLIDPKGNGQMVRYDDLSPNLMVPLWMIFEF